MVRIDHSNRKVIFVFVCVALESVTLTQAPHKHGTWLTSTEYLPERSTYSSEFPLVHVNSMKHMISLRDLLSTDATHWRKLREHAYVPFYMSKQSNYVNPHHSYV